MLRSDVPTNLHRLRLVYSPAAAVLMPVLANMNSSLFGVVNQLPFLRIPSVIEPTTSKLWLCISDFTFTEYQDTLQTLER